MSSSSHDEKSKFIFYGIIWTLDFMSRFQKNVFSEKVKVGNLINWQVEWISVLIVPFPGHATLIWI
jgi:hypothetical protein